MIHLHMIKGGKALGEIQSLVAAEMALPVGEAATRDALLAAEKDISTVTDVIAPAIAIVGKPHADLVLMIAATDIRDAVETHTALKQSRAAAEALCAVLATAETTLRNTITDVVLDQLAELEQN
jgi:hypothetical protein